MATIYAENWVAGNSLFSSIYRYDKPTDGADPLYPFMYSAEGVYINGFGMLDKNPAHTGEFETYQQAGVWIKGAGGLTGGGIGIFAGSGFWDGTVGCIECLYHPTTESLLGEGVGGVQGNHCPLISVTNPNASVRMGVDASIEDQTLTVYHDNDGSHASSVVLVGAPMPVAGQLYKVRIGWQCGTYNVGLDTADPDGFMRVWINDALAYEATLISLVLSYFTSPANRIDSVLFGYMGLLGPQSYFTISDSACAPISPLVFRSGGTEYPVAWMEHTLRA